MPNWCANSLSLQADGEMARLDLHQFVCRVTGTRHSECSIASMIEAGTVPFFLEQVYPVPGDYRFDPVVASDWRLLYWGCRRYQTGAAISQTLDGTIVFMFQTAWTPPIAWVHHASTVYPNLLFTITYSEPLAFGNGVYEVIAGQVQQDIHKDPS